jgi:hypothetical protein
MIKLISTLIIASTFLLSNHAQAASLSPLSINVAPPVQFPPRDWDVTGIRAGLFGQHRDVSGIDIGVLGNRTTGKFKGLAVAGGLNWTEGETIITGLQFAGIANINKQKTTVVGLQAAAVNYNSAASSVFGLQFSLANLAGHTNVYGVQAGIYNKAQRVVGFQIGLVNVAQNLTGLQIGLVNVHEKGLFKICPIINFGF